MEYDFKHGDFIVPDNDISAAFHYDAVNTVLNEHVEYRLATSAEFIYCKKSGNMTLVDGGLDKYKKSKSNDVGAVYKSMETQSRNQKKNN